MLYQYNHKYIKSYKNHLTYFYFFFFFFSTTTSCSSSSTSSLFFTFLLFFLHLLIYYYFLLNRLNTFHCFFPLPFLWLLLILFVGLLNTIVINSFTFEFIQYFCHYIFILIQSVILQISFNKLQSVFHLLLQLFTKSIDWID